MKVTIKRSTDIDINLKKVRLIKKVGKFNASKFCGVINLNHHLLEIQNQMRNEWQAY